MTRSTSASTSASSNATRKVTFDSRVRCKFTIHHRNYTQTERASTWITAEESSASKDAIRTSLLAIQNGQITVERGLEFRTRVAAKRRVAIKNEGRAIVLDEQAEQRDSGRNDADYIGHLYAEYTSASQQQAEIRGLMDERVARQMDVVDNAAAAKCQRQQHKIGHSINPSMSRSKASTSSANATFTASATATAVGASKKQRFLSHTTARLSHILIAGVKPLSSSSSSSSLRRTSSSPTLPSSVTLPSKSRSQSRSTQLSKALGGPIRVLLVGKAA